MKVFLKTISLFILPSLVFILTFLYFQAKRTRVLTVKETGEKILSIPYQNTVYEDFGMIYTPNILLAVKTTDSFKNYNFLVDTGAIVSAMPAKETSQMGLNLAFLPRLAVEGYGGQITFTYRGKIDLKLLDDLISLPCVFSDVDQSNYILGRKGLFENYTISFNSERKAVEFIKK